VDTNFVFFPAVTQSKLRLLSNNRLLALLLNRKKMEIRALRDSNSKLSVSLSQYKHAYRNLRNRLEATNTTVRNLQNAAPIITRDILSLFDRFEKMGKVLTSVNIDEIENQSFLSNISLADNSQKPKPLRKRRGKLPLIT
jgi:molecular chaperone GrpE (heat shock protein)